MAFPSSWAKQIYRMLVVQPRASEEIGKRKYKILHKENAKYFKLQSTPFFLVPVVSGQNFFSRPDLSHTMPAPDRRVPVSCKYQESHAFMAHILVLQIWKTKVISGTNFCG